MGARQQNQKSKSVQSPPSKDATKELKTVHMAGHPIVENAYARLSRGTLPPSRSECRCWLATRYNNVYVPVWASFGARLVLMMLVKTTVDSHAYQVDKHTRMTKRPVTLEC